MTEPAVTPDGIAQGLEKLRPIGVTEEDLVPGVSTTGHVADLTRVLQPQRLRHDPPVYPRGP